MGSKGSSAPEPPDPQETSAAQTGTNVSTAVANAYLGNVNQVTPDGSLSYDQTGSYTYSDPYTGQTYEIPTFTATQQLSPEQQAIYDQNQGAELNLATLANDQSAFLNDYMADPFSYNPGAHEEWALGLYDDLNRDSISSQEAQLHTNLVQRGIAPGSEAYNKEMENFYGGQQNAQNQFLLDSYNTGMQTALTERNQPINEITALLSGSQVSMPSFVNTSMPQIPTTDNAGIINSAYQNEYNAWAQDQQSRNSLLGGLFDAGGSLGAAYIMSDPRLKAEAQPAGEASGMRLWSYRYLGTAKTRVGLMADEVAAVKPWAVRIRDGFAEVNYREALA